MSNKSYPCKVGKNKEESFNSLEESVNTEFNSSLSFSPITQAKHVFNNKQEENENVLAKRPDHLKEQVIDENSNGEENPDKSYTGLLSELCQRLNQEAVFKSVEQREPVHDPEFALKVIINGKEFPEGCGKTEKEAKEKAAQLAYRELNDSDFISQTTTSPLTSPLQVSERDYTTSGSASDSPSEQPNIKSRFLEDFDSVTKIGKGGFGRVNKARRKLENKYFAVKVVKHNMKALREVTTLSRLEHRNIVRYHTSWTEDTAYVNSSDSSSSSSSDSGRGEGSRKFLYIQMELCEEKTLREWIEERNNHPKQYPERRQEAAKIIKQVLQAVDYIHSNKLIHRDLKPANIMLGLEGHVKVGDFGLVTTEDEEDDGRPLNRTKSAGTRSYMSPEQREQPTYGRKVDIFPVGLIYFELLWLIGTQHEKHEIWEKIRSQTFPEKFSKLFNFEHKLIEQMLCENPDRRPEASKLVRQLEQHLSATTEHTDG